MPASDENTTVVEKAEPSHQHPQLSDPPGPPIEIARALQEALGVWTWEGGSL